MSAAFIAAVPPLEAIARLSKAFPVFPCRRNPEEIVRDGKTILLKPKQPFTSNGFHDASQNADQVRAWWNRWPEALCGVPTGAQTGLVVIDYDSDKADEAGREWLEKHMDELMSTRSHSTLSGGRHYLFRCPDAQSYRSGVCVELEGKKRGGIDIRAAGGYVIWWPLHGATVSGEIALLPAGLVDERKTEKRDWTPLPSSPEKWRREKPRVVAALPWLDPEDYDAWIRAGMAIHGASGGSDDGFELWHAWSCGDLTGSPPENYGGIEDCRYRWTSFKTSGNGSAPIGLGSLIASAKKAGFTLPPKVPPSLSEPPADESPPVEAYEVDEAIAAGERIWGSSRPQRDDGDEGAPQPKAPMHAPIDWVALEGKTPPPREWVVPDWIPAGHTTLLSGKGGIGKTLIAQQLATAIALGKTFLAPLDPRKVLMWAGEDDERELWWRQRNICSYFEVQLSDLAGNFILHSYASADITLASTEYGALIPTAGLEALRRQVAQEAPDLVILDNIARLYGGNENVRHDVTTFCAWVQAACAPAAVLLLGHPAKAKDSEFSGSTAWEGAVRSRLYLGDRPPDEKETDDDAPPTPDRFRYLCRRKANYSDQDMAVLSLVEGVFFPTQAPSTSKFSTDSDICRDAVLNCIERLADINLYGSLSTSSASYLPKLAQQYGFLGSLTHTQFTATMRSLVRDKVIGKVEVGHYDNRTKRFGIAKL